MDSITIFKSDKTHKLKIEGNDILEITVSKDYDKLLRKYSKMLCKVISLPVDDIKLSFLVRRAKDILKLKESEKIYVSAQVPLIQHEQIIEMAGQFIIFQDAMELLSTISIRDKENKKAIIDGIEEYYREDKEKDLKIRFFEKELFGVAGVLYCDDMFFFFGICKEDDYE